MQTGYYFVIRSSNQFCTCSSDNSPEATERVKLVNGQVVNSNDYLFFQVVDRHKTPDIKKYDLLIHKQFRLMP
jgi:hypothetical protein